MPQVPRKVVIPEQFDQCFHEEALIAEFDSPEAEAEYERRDSFLIHLIRNEVRRHFGDEEKNQPFIGDDWWPDHTRHIEMEPVHCTAGFFSALRSLLTDDYQDYRIQICVYADNMDGGSFMGSMVLYADRDVVETRLNELLPRFENCGSGLLPHPNRAES